MSIKELHDLTIHFLFAPQIASVICAVIAAATGKRHIPVLITIVVCYTINLIADLLIFDWLGILIDMLIIAMWGRNLIDALKEEKQRKAENDQG